MKFKYIILVAIIGLVSCGQNETLNTDLKLEEKVKERVMSGKKILDLGKLTDFDWDSLLILTPYQDPDKIEVEFGVDLSSIKHAKIQSRDDISQLIFFANGKPVHMLEYPRYPGDFSRNMVQFIQRDSALFDIVTMDKRAVVRDNRI